MKTLKLGSTGNQVEKWQYFLRGLGYHLDVTGEFDELTDIATKKFQEKNKLYVDGIVGNQTFGKAAMLGFPIIDVNDDYNPEFPNKPDFKPITGTKLRQEMFGPLEFESAPTKSNPEGLKITNNFKNKIVPVEIPQLIGIKGAPKTGIIYVHMKVRDQIQGLWAEWGRLGLLDRILTFDGVFNARFIRGKAKEQILSNHAFGTAFDINAAWNPYGAIPATADQKGCVYDLVRIAHQYGMYWGGHFKKPDGMHFEIAQIL
ncbi:M15 family metallopeptidase [Acinetobacter calcoaceticus]|uniref:M15 family metallopeptidase n=1 Tax=Acinetobacter calcoaceticus TaxID=471 RepID=UPI001E46E7DE|nr:M15 family metallopeptidase [Acinetobacter calcoaceticus]UGQ31549.1 M15 family metallopeptidase [Acinetobacter calcoaceticus]